MSPGSIDVVLVGGGHNGLVAAACLARSGLGVLVLEAAAGIGGGAAPYEIHPGFHLPSLAHLPPAFDRRAVAALNLPPGGPAAVTSMLLLPDGGAVALGPDARVASESLRRHSSADAKALPEFLHRLQGHAEALRPLLESTPPRLQAGDRGGLLALGRLAWSIRRRGRPAMRDLMRIITMNVADLLEENLDSHIVRGAFALDAVLGTDHGPRSPNTVFTLLHRLAGQIAAGGSASGTSTRPTAEALDRAAASAGVQVRTGARVARIRVEAGAARGVELADGSVIDAGVVVSNADPVTTFSELVGPDHLDADFLAAVKAIRTRGTTGKVGFALERMPGLPAPPGGGPVRWLLAPSIDYVEKAFDHVKYGEAVPEPALEITLPSLADPGRAPEGAHVMSVNVAYAPYAAPDPSVLARTVTEQIERHAPGFSASVLACEAWGPREIEQRFGVRGGHWHHGDIALDQFFITRPVPGFAQYRTPVEGLYLCGAGTHPGGGVTGTSGFNAAREILRDRKAGRGDR